MGLFSRKEIVCERSLLVREDAAVRTKVRQIFHMQLIEYFLCRPFDNIFSNDLSFKSVSV
jgi:hypothetical protein